MQEGWRHDVWEGLHLAYVSFADLGLHADASDRAVWGKYASVSKSSCSPQTVMMQVRTRWKPLFNNTTRLTVSLSSRLPMTSVYCEIGCMLKLWPTG
jgi:hypothetical protein